VTSLSSDGINIIFINYLMKQINDCSDGIYEELVDANYKEVEVQISKLKNILEELNQSIQDDLETTT
jgi:hypothetical protein